MTKPPPPRMPRGIPLPLVLLVLLSILAVSVWRGGDWSRPQPSRITYSEFLQRAETGGVKKVVIDPDPHSLVIQGTFNTEKEEPFTTTFLPYDDALTDRLRRAGVEFEVKPSEGEWFQEIVYMWGPALLMIAALYYFFFRQIQGSGNRAFTFGKARVKTFDADRPKTTFADVAGVDEAKVELQEIIEFLKERQKFIKLGAKIPKGVLLVGPPGTGKTLLARAVAGEANVPFFSISGSDFVEMFVGVGASRVRDLFEQGKHHAPCIIFIDEIDAVGRHRGWGMGGGHDEREQTLNALLVEMDGFDSREGIILVAATNRPDILDPALLRPGRFDRRVVVDLPDLEGRLGILKVHTKEIPIASDVDLGVIARGTPFFSGADLANLVNEAALLAARRGRKEVTLSELEEARDKVMMGPERRSRQVSEKEKRIVAYHEAGHALVARKLPGTDPVHKVTLIPRGVAALGATYQLPERDKYLRDRGEYLNDVTILLGGRVAEEVVFGEITGGAGSDLKRVAEIVRKMVCEWGMSDTLGPLTYGHVEEYVFIGREIAREQNYSEVTAREIDSEVRRIVSECYDRATRLIVEHREALDRLAEALLEREVLDGEEVEKVIAGETLPPRVLAPAPAGTPAGPGADGKRAPRGEAPEMTPAPQPA